MQQKNDTIFYEGRAISHGANREFLDISTPAGESTEKELLLVDTETSTAPRKSVSLSDKLKLAVLAILGCCIPLIWALNGCMSAGNVQGDEISSANFDLVKDAVPAPSAPASAPAVLEVFQVYQPVLTPSGATDETILGNGAENTTTIAQAAASSSCEVLLMDHSFGYSYGVPFVGKFEKSFIYNLSNFAKETILLPAATSIG
jgi:hypothetical protein